NLFVTENDTVTLAASFFIPPQIRNVSTFTWQKSTTTGATTFTNIPGGTGSQIQFTARLADDGFTYRLAFTGPGATTNFSTILHVAVDDQPPVLVSADSLDGTTLTLVYNKPVTVSSACEPFNVILNNSPDPIQTTGANEGLGVRLSDERTIIFSLDPINYLVGPFHVDVYSIESAAQTPVAGDGSADGAVEFLIAANIGVPDFSGFGGYNTALP